MARPSKYSQELIDTICERIADGDSLRSICREEGMPEARTVQRWLNNKPEFCQQYARAKEDGADAFAEQILDEANKTDSKNAQAVKVKTDILFRLMALRNPKKYNAKLDLTSSDGSMATDKNIQVTFVKSPNDQSK